jgi:hypothetical protein
MERKQVTFVSVLALLAGIACALGGSAAARSLDAPTITSVSPGSAFAGSNVVIHGTNLTGATVSFKLKKPGAVAVTVLPENAIVNAAGTKITVVIPDGSDAAGGQLVTAGKNGLWVSTPQGQVVWKMGFVVKDLKAMKPTITGFGPRKAGPGAFVTIFGSHFSGAKVVKLGGVDATFRIPNDSRILVKVPVNAHAGKWSVKTATGTALSPQRFVVTTPAT